jgi:hypothetical protein
MLAMAVRAGAGLGTGALGPARSMKALDVGYRSRRMRSLRRVTSILAGTALLAACKPTQQPNAPEPGSAAVASPVAPEPTPAPAAADGTHAADTGSREPAPAVVGSPGAAEITCSFHWRKGVSHDFRPRDEKQVRVRTAGDGGALELGDARIGVALEANAAGGRNLVVGIDVGSTRIDEGFDFGKAQLPANLPPGGHGFTGLHYVTHPSSGSELQYWCESGAPATAGPASPAGTTLMCETIVTKGGQSSSAVHSLDPSGATGLPGPSFAAELGELQLGVTYMPGRHDSGGVLLDVGAAGGEGPLVHVLYQLHGEELPSNLFAGTAGFTGRTIVRDASGDQAEYGCWAVG